MPIKDRGKYLAYQREYNKKRKQRRRSLHPESIISHSQPPFSASRHQGVTTQPTSHVPGCKPSALAYIPNAPVKAIPSKMPASATRARLGAPAKPARATTGEEQTAARNRRTDKPEARRSNRYSDVSGQIVRHGVGNPKKAAM